MWSSASTETIQVAKTEGGEILEAKLQTCSFYLIMDEVTR